MALQGAAQRLTDIVVEGLVTLIAENNLVAGDKLPTARELCDRFGVSRTVVREAVASLQAEGRVTSRRGSGVFVQDGAPRPPRSLIMGSPQDIADVLEIMELRMSVEIETAGLAAQRRTETDLLRIERAMSAFARHMQDGTMATDADRDLHITIASATANPKFRYFVEEIGERLIPRRALGAAFADPADQLDYLRTIHAEHRDIVDAIVERDEERARRAMRRHLENGRRRYRNWNVEQA